MQNNQINHNKKTKKTAAYIYYLLCSRLCLNNIINNYNKYFLNIKTISLVLNI